MIDKTDKKDKLSGGIKLRLSVRDLLQALSGSLQMDTPRFVFPHLTMVRMAVG